ncbi:MAG: allantoinase AllB [Verrucomicrobia bacterium]|nr:allantoinase AllB [Verrucomicrobiota bacterium]
MQELDLILRGGTMVTHDGESVSDIGVSGGQIVAVGNIPSGSAREIVDATGLHIFPGLIDSHVHFNDPGRADWEGIETGSSALAAGGGTMFFDMPLNAHPPTCDAESFDLKLAVAQKTSLTDFAFWGGLVPCNLDKLEELADRGVIGFKVFMSNSGIEDFPHADDETLKGGMTCAASLGKLVAVHAESESITSELSKLQFTTSVRDYLDSRPVRAELAAIQRAIELAGETKCSLHIVHVSSGAGAFLIADARAQGVDVTCETCPHYLALTEDDMEKLGAIAKCAPPLRSTGEQEDLWLCVQSGMVTTIGSDHSPSPPDMKRDKNFFNVWGGISGIQHTLPLLITEGHVNRQLALSHIARLTSFNVAERFSLPKTKGRIAIGADADLTLVDLNAGFTVRGEDLLYRHKHSPYVGRALTGRVVRTILRGQTIFDGSKIVSPPAGRLVRPQH